MIVYWTVRGFARLLAWLPPGLVLTMGRGVGRFAYFVPRVRRKVVLQNLRYVFGDAPGEPALRDIARRAYEQLGMTAFEVLRAAGGGSHELCRQVTYSHLEPFRERRAAGQPLIILQSHFGNFDLVAYAFATQGFPLHTVMKKLPNKKLNELLVTTRQQHHITVHLKGKETFSTLRDALQRGDWIGVLPDQRPRKGRGVEVRFLGKPARLFQGPALLHLETGAPIAYCFGARQNDPGRHHVTFDFLEPHAPTGDREADVRAVMQQIADAMGRAIRRHPDHYFWFHRLWGKRLGASG